MNTIEKLKNFLYWKQYGLNSELLFSFSKFASLFIPKPERKYWLLNQQRVINGRRDKGEQREFDRILEKKLQEGVILPGGGKQIKRDFRICTRKYGIVAEEYYSLDMEHRSAEERERIVSRWRQFHIVASLCLSNNKELIDDKAKFTDVFKKYLGRQSLDMKSCTKDEFLHVIHSHEYIIVKPTDQMSGKGVFKVKTNEMSSGDIDSLWEKYHLTNTLVEECINQQGILHDICPDSVNTIRLTTLNDGEHIEIPFSFLRTGRMGKCVDNLHSGGIVWPLDHTRGIISGMGYNTNGDEYEIHPDTKISMVGLQIPNWDKAIETVKEAAMLVPDVRMIGWDVCISGDDILLIEGNCSTGFWRPYSKEYDLWGFMKNWMDKTLGENREMKYF